MTRAHDEIEREFSRWIECHGRFITDVGDMLAESCAKLIELGLPLDRVSTHIRIIHPRARSVWRIWRRDRPVEVRLPVHDSERTEAFLRSPVKRVWDTGDWLDHPIGPEGPDTWGILTDLREQGFTHYLIGPLVFSNREFHAASFATKHPGGFTPDQVELVQRIAERMRGALEPKSLRRGMSELFDTYLGQATAKLLEEGQVRLGEGLIRRAALWYSDMRGFTRITEGAPLEEVVRTLNVYFGLVGAAAERHGGEVVQFIGDAILIFFSATHEGGDRDACHRAYQAALEARAELGQWNEVRRSAGQCGIDFGIGLELGDIIHVNVGSAGRQAFNIVGPAVNRAARIEELTKTLGRGILMSRDFADALGEGYRPVGEFPLRGVAKPIEVTEPFAPPGSP